jgi:hypothetical protein
MVEIRVAFEDSTGAPGLMRRLVALFDRPSVSYDSALNEVQVVAEWESRGVVHVLCAVESWLAEEGPDSALLSVGDRSYTMVAAAGGSR